MPLSGECLCRIAPAPAAVMVNEFAETTPKTKQNTTFT
jgi:hypothetical protein